MGEAIKGRAHQQEDWGMEIGRQKGKQPNHGPSQDITHQDQPHAKNEFGGGSGLKNIQGDRFLQGPSYISVGSYF